MLAGSRRPHRSRRAPLRFEVSSENPKTLRNCQGILQKMIQHKNAKVFMHPVDPIALNIPDYFDIVKRPMDLMTVQKRLSSGFYDSASSFQEEMMLIWKNAMLYNPKSNPVHYAAKIMMKDFSELFRNVEKEQLKVKNKKKHASPWSKKRERKPVKMHAFSGLRKSNGNISDNGEDDVDFDKRKNELARARREFAELQQKVARLEKIAQRRKAFDEKEAAVRRTSSKRLILQIPETKERSLDLSREQKRGLMEGIKSLTHGELVELSESLFPGSAEEEIELDLETIDSEMYMVIQNFVSSRRHFRTPSDVPAPRSPRRISTPEEEGAKECDSGSESDSESDSSSDSE